MNRVAPGIDTSTISETFALIPQAIQDLVGDVHFLVGSDPVAAGLHGYEVTDDGRSYRRTAHVTYASHQELARAERRTTIVVPAANAMSVNTIAHEYGHVLDERLNFDVSVIACTGYAATNRMEAFAEAFCAWVLPARTEARRPRPEAHSGHWSFGKARDYLLDRDPGFMALMESLASR